MLFSGNNFFTPVLVMGVIMAGGIYNSANPAYTPRELAHQLRDSESRFIFVAENCLARAQQAVDSVGVGRDRIFLFEELSLVPGPTMLKTDRGNFSPTSPCSTGVPLSRMQTVDREFPGKT